MQCDRKGEGKTTLTRAMSQRQINQADVAIVLLSRKLQSGPASDITKVKQEIGEKVNKYQSLLRDQSTDQQLRKTNKNSTANSAQPKRE